MEDQQGNKLDGQLFFGDTDVHSEEKSTSEAGTIFEKVLFKTKDPTTLPQSEMSCVKMCSAWPLGDFCCGWKYRFRWMYVTASVKVKSSVPSDIQGAVEDCLKQSAVAAAIAALIPPGGAAAAIAAAELAMKGCLSSKLGQDLLSVEIDLDHTWGGWE